MVAEAGGEIVITRVGHTFVKAAMAERNAIFGGEHSAHYYFRDFWGADTGMLAGLHVLALVGRSDRPLSELSARFNRYAASGEINTLVEDQQLIMDRVADGVRRPGRAGSDRRADGGRSGLVGQRPPEQHRAAAPAERRGGERVADGCAAR